MARKPEARYASAADLRAALLAAQRHLLSHPEPAISADPTVESEQVSFVRSERSWLVPTAIVVAVALALVAGGLVFDRTGAGHGLVNRVTSAFGSDNQKATTTTTTTPPRPLAVQKVTDMNPFGDGHEHPERVANVIDGDPSTTWVTQSYLQDFPHLKPGVGLAFDLHDPSPVSSLRVTTVRPGWTASIYVSDKAANVNDLASWGNPVTSFTAADSTTVVNLPKGTHGAALLIWFTSLGTQPGTDGQYRVEIAEVELDG
jgi:putative peptidoglycan lipid II flippase